MKHSKLKTTSRYFYAFLFILSFLLSMNTALHSQKNNTPILFGDVISIVEKTIIQGTESTLISQYDAQENLLWQKEYDESGRKTSITRSQHYPNDSSLQFIYNEEGEISITTTSYCPNDSTSIFSFQNENNNIKDTTIHHSKYESTIYGSRGIIRSFRTYDKKGNLLETIRKNSKNETLVHIKNTYSKFDSLDNWQLKETVLKRGQKSMSIRVERSINYLHEDRLENMMQISTLDLTYDKSIGDFFSDHAIFDFASARYFNKDYYYQLKHSELPLHRKIHDLKIKALVIDLKDNCYYTPNNFSDEWVKDCKHNYRSKYRFDAQGFKLISTGEYFTINEVRCEKYKLIKKEDIVEYYYVDATRPFVNYGEFETTFPGFVMKSKRMNDRGYYEWTVKLTKTEFPSQELDVFDSFHNRKSN